MSDLKRDLPKATERLEFLIRAGEQALTGACEAVQVILSDLRTGEVRAIKALVPAQTELSKALRQAVEIERTYHDWRHRTSDALAAGEIDVDAVRLTLRGKLDSLREAIGSREVHQ